MGYKVGQKGQVVISKEAREKLGVEPGWTAVQMVVGDHLEIRFFPPPHQRSLLGILAPYVNEKNRVTTWEAWDDVRERAWANAIRESEPYLDDEGESGAEEAAR